MTVIDELDQFLKAREEPLGIDCFDQFIATKHPELVLEWQKYRGV